jgi:hypothetical protein
VQCGRLLQMLLLTPCQLDTCVRRVLCLSVRLHLCVIVWASPCCSAPRLQGCLIKERGSEEVIGLPACSGVKVGRGEMGQMEVSKVVPCPCLSVCAQQPGHT